MQQNIADMLFLRLSRATGQFLYMRQKLSVEDAPCRHIR